ncbi:MAG: family 43 glycosylhydrolase [Lachnospiraceae bacterium]|nr:family 43 glycosylhydrolase [Lachnospiraceae bacterium]
MSVTREHLFEAAGHSEPDIVRYIVEYSMISLNEKDDHNRNVLHYCAKSGSGEVFEYLVRKCGMDPLSSDENGITPWECAIENNNEEVAGFINDRYGSIDKYYKNPVRRGFYPDPSIVRVDRDYYMVNSSFVFFPCIPVSHSRDLIHWNIIGYAITDPDIAGLGGLRGGRGYWAPDISYYEGKFYITATLRYNDVPPVYRRQIVVSSDKPEGPYSEPVYIEEDGIDPSIFNDDDGQRYMLLNRGARILKLNKDATKVIGEPSLLYYGDMKRAPEGPHLYKKDGYYYLLLAEGGTGMGHRITVMRSETLMGDYIPCPYNPIMIQRDEKASIQRCGHGDMVSTPEGDYYMVYLCGRRYADKYSLLGRETAIDPIEWTADGWPIVNGLKGPSVLQRKPVIKDIKTESREREKINDVTRLSAVGLPVEYMTVRGFDKGEIKCTAVRIDKYNESDTDGDNKESRKDIRVDFEIRGSRYPLSSIKSRNMVLRRQTSYDFRTEVSINLDMDIADGQECGITGYYDENTFCLFGIRKTEGELYLFSLEHIGEQDIIYKDSRSLRERCAPDTSGIKLMMKTKGLQRILQYSFITDEINDDFTEHTFNTLENVYYLCDEGIKKGKRFTGAMVGLYAYEGKNSEKPFLCRMRDYFYEDEECC